MEPEAQLAKAGVEAKVITATFRALSRRVGTLHAAREAGEKAAAGMVKADQASKKAAAKSPAKAPRKRTKAAVVA